MRKFYVLLAILAFSTTTFGQINIGTVSDSTVATFVFCMPLVERTDSLVILKCGDIKMEIKKEEFHGQITIIIIPNEENGPITEKQTINWYMLPENKE